MSRRNPAPPASSPLVVPTDDGVELRGWHLPAISSTPGARPAVFVLAHGFTTRWPGHRCGGWPAGCGRSGTCGPAPMRRVHWLLESPLGRGAGVRLLRLRLAAPWSPPPPSPLEVAHLIAPTPLLLVHGDEDSYFPLQMFRSLVRAAGPAAEAWVVPGMGHAEGGMTAPLVERIGRWASESIQG